MEELVREWAPLVWLAPNEKFMPGDVTEFLQHVHAEKAKTKRKNGEADAGSAEVDEAAYYDIDNEFSMILGPTLPNTWENRNKRMFNYIIDLPLGEYSANWYLVTNDGIGKIELIEDWLIFLRHISIISLQTICWRTRHHSSSAKLRAPAMSRSTRW